MQVENERVRRVINLLIVVAVLTVIVFVWNLVTHNKGTVKDIFNNLTIKGKIQDSYNGIYNHPEDLEKKINAFKGCSISKVNNYILVIYDKFYIFRSSCLGTYLKETGNTDDLNIATTDKDYYIMYKNVRYDRDYTVRSIVPNNAIAHESGKLDLNSLPIILKETQFEGNYYELNREIDGVSDKIKINVKRRDDGLFNVSFWYNRDILYTQVIQNFDNMARYYPYGDMIVIIEREISSDKYSDHFKILNKNKGITYDLADEFNVKVDDVTLNYQNNSIVIVFDTSNRHYKMFVGKDKNFCVKNGSSDKIAFYEFKIVYNHAKGTFDKPVFVANHYESEGCSYIEKYLSGGSK